MTFVKDNEPFIVDLLNKPDKAIVRNVPLCDVLDRYVIRNLIKRTERRRDNTMYD